MHDKAELKEAIASNAFVRNLRIVNNDEVTLGKWLFDFRALLLQSKWLNSYAELFWEEYASQYPFQVCGMESAAISLVAAIAMKGLERGTPVNGLYIRKSRKRSGLMKQIEGVLTKDPVILVDDLINSGNTFNKQIKVLSDEGVRVSDIFVLLAFRDANAYRALTDEQNISLKSIFTLQDFNMPLLSSESTTIPRDSFEILWHFRVPNPSHNYVVQKSAPVLDGERVYFGTDAGTFFALNQTTGDVAWMFDTGKHPEGKGIFSSPAILKGTVYFGAYDGNVYALDAQTGAKKWTYGDADWVGSSPALAEDRGLLFIGLEFGLLRKQGGIAALRLDTGERVWHARTSAYTHGTPLYIPEWNMVVIGSNDATVYAYKGDSGELLWQLSVDGDVKASFAYDAKRKLILFGTLAGTLYAARHDGAIAFAKELSAGMYSTPHVQNDTVYFSSLDKCLYAINMDTWKDTWTFMTNGRIFASPIIIEGSLWCGSNDGRLYEIDPLSGKLRTFFQATEKIVNKIAHNADTKRFFVPTNANELYCFVRKI
jgi:outer membrane protein assembly factor BamB/adenine/guanine phosphoribosyltransferase-like PRPP-binding protein